MDELTEIQKRKGQSVDISLRLLPAVVWKQCEEPFQLNEDILKI